MQLGLFDITEEQIEQFKELFNKREWERIESHLDIVLRDRRIRNQFRSLRTDGMKYDEAIRYLSGTFYLSESQISHIVYPRKGRK